MWIFGTGYNTLEIVGCASHSSTTCPVEQAPVPGYSEKDKERIAAAMAVATFCSGIPEVFDTIQLNCKVPKETAASFAKAMLVILDDTEAWVDLIERLSRPLHQQQAGDVLNQLGKYIDDADNTFSTGTHGQAILIHNLVDWMVSKGWQP
jgi:hypothetical protein